MIVASPMDELELRNLLYSAVNTPSPYSIRYPRGCGAGAKWEGEPFEAIPTGKGRRLKKGNEVAVLTIGPVAHFAKEAIERVESAYKTSVAHYDLRFAKPLDEELLHEVGRTFSKVITIEDGALRGGVGEAVVKFFNDNGYTVNVKTMGIEDKFIEHGTPAELYALCGFDAAGIEQQIKSML
jgi:1-deoxy-D-xylulose-5-phosphate synthase